MLANHFVSVYQATIKVAVALLSLLVSCIAYPPSTESELVCVHDGGIGVSLMKREGMIETFLKPAQRGMWEHCLKFVP